MQALFASGHVAALILGFTGLEILALLLSRGRLHGMAPSRYLPTIAAGAFLLLAWWLSAINWPLAAAALAGALVAHLSDLKSRWR